MSGRWAVGEDGKRPWATCRRCRQVHRNASQCSHILRWCICTTAQSLLCLAAGMPYTDGSPGAMLFLPPMTLPRVPPPIPPPIHTQPTHTRPRHGHLNTHPTHLTVHSRPPGRPASRRTTPPSCWETPGATSRCGKQMHVAPMLADTVWTWRGISGGRRPSIPCTPRPGSCRPAVWLTRHAKRAVVWCWLSTPTHPEPPNPSTPSIPPP